MKAAEETFVCVHGTAHTKKDFDNAAAWAEKVYRDATLVEVGETCWIIAWRRETQ